MGLRISIQHDFLRLAEAFSELDAKAIVAASKRALNRTLLTLRKESIKEITQKIRVKPAELRSRYIRLEKAGQGANVLEAALVFSGESLHLLKFVRGNKEPIKQAGISVKRRRKLRVEITPGKAFVLKGGFIQKANSAQVFRRGKGRGLIRQTAPSIGFMVLNRGIGETIKSIGQMRLSRALASELNFQLIKMRAKMAEGLK